MVLAAFKILVKILIVKLIAISSMPSKVVRITIGISVIT
jgi:hypothetical protein